MANKLAPPDKLCSALTKAGLPCGAPASPSTGLCVSHHAPTQERLRRLRAQAKDAPPIPTISVDQLMGLDLTKGDALAIARSGVWQNLLAGTLEPHVAKVALDVAETIATAARRAPRDEKGVAERVTAAVLAKPPPQPDAE